jgi:RNA-directed DNA polymerase
MFFQVKSDLPHISNIDEFSESICLSKSTIYTLSKFNNHFYREVKIPKKNGTERLLACPSKKMKAVQGWILRNILEKIIISKCASAYIKGQSILPNVFPHKNNKYVLAMDLKDYFPTIKYGWIYSVFKNLGYNSHLSHVFTRLSTYKDALPQGGVTSPTLSNIVSYRLDRRLSTYAGKLNVIYTRYADDITYSANTPMSFNKLKEFTTMVLHEEGFEVNSAKTRILGPKQRKKITGLVIDNGKYGIGKYKKNELRVLIHKIFTTPILEERRKLHLRYEGWLAYTKNVDVIAHKQLLKQYKKNELKFTKQTN